MKKWLILLSGIVAITIIGIILYFTLKPTENNIITISGKELLEKVNNKDTFILVRTQDGCSHCEEYKPVLNRVLTENNIKAYELNTTKLKEEEQETRNEIDKLFNISGTPTTIFINEGEEQTTINRIVGTTTYSTLKEKLKERGFIE